MSHDAQPLPSPALHSNRFDCILLNFKSPELRRAASPLALRDVVSGQIGDGLMGLVTLVVLSNLNDFVVFWFYDLKMPWASLCPASNGIRLEKCTSFILRVFRHGLSKPNPNQDHFLWEFLKEIRILLQYFVVFLNMSPASITDWITGKQEVLVLVFFFTNAVASSALLCTANIYLPKQPFSF